MPKVRVVIDQPLNDLLQIVPANHIISIEVYKQKSNAFYQQQLPPSHFVRPPSFTVDAKGMLGFHRLWCSVRKHGHHVEKVLERNVAIVARAEHLADPIAERVCLQLRILKDLAHGQLRVLVVAHLFRG